ncbi:DUF655 domain-containing protein [archaeon CG_4_8_14_3_um_filter_38_5]|nr:MAG: DUF655 domain-containing protein [archaeon CG07_land_8_20_14_0_80_38_8]PIX44761.1 MAG: DUF655 domain-containing protein [archaeon CG_4_8_14_3_um_filter_38_5]
MMRDTLNIKEDYAVVLEFLQHGHPFEGRRIPTAQVIGKEHLVLLELVPKRNVVLSPMENVYIGPDKRDKVHHVIGKIDYSKLTSTAKINFDKVLESIIDENPKKWIDFFNNARSISIRLHQLEILPGVGKKHMKEILEQREEKPFESFEDISNRISLMPNPKEIIIKRIKMELDNLDKYKLFVG